MDKLTVNKNFVVECNYGMEENAVYNFHLFTFLMTVPIAILLWNNSNLRQFYTPLAKVVNVSIVLYFVSCLIFFYYWNYGTNETDGNCEEIFLSRLTTMSVMFGELHQIYVIAHTLGLGTMRISTFSERSYSLEQILMYSTITGVSTILFAFFFYRDILYIVELSWTIFVCLAQLYIINAARKSRESLREFSAISVTDSSISIFEKMSIIQLLLSTFCFVYRSSTEIMGAQFAGNIELTLVLLDQVSTFLFYMKVLLIKERTNVTVTVV